MNISISPATCVRKGALVISIRIQYKKPVNNAYTNAIAASLTMTMSMFALHVALEKIDKLLIIRLVSVSQGSMKLKTVNNANLVIILLQIVLTVSTIVLINHWMRQLEPFNMVAFNAQQINSSITIFVNHKQSAQEILF